MRKRYLLVWLATAATGSAAIAGETPFTPDAAATWSARSLRMARIVDIAFGEKLTKDNFKEACDGLTGEQMKHEYGKVPRWALSSQLLICSAYDGWAGKFQGSKTPCKALEKGLEALDQSKADPNPPEVAAAANELRNAVNAILISAHANKGACKR